MRQFDIVFLPKIREFSAKQIINLRKKNKASQKLFAKYLNITVYTLQNWEKGNTKPSSAALKLLNLVADHGLEWLAM